MAISYKIAKHATAYPTKVLASNGGKHIYNIELNTDTDNGNFVAKGDLIELDLYDEAAVKTFAGKIVLQAANGNWYVEVVNPGDALFVYQVPMIEEEWTNNFKKESNFYNKAGETVRAYELAVGDIVEVSAEAFSGTPAKDKAVSVVSKKLKVATE